jgi:hypothetical protein
LIKKSEKQTYKAGGQSIVESMCDEGLDSGRNDG